MFSSLNENNSMEYRHNRHDIEPDLIRCVLCREKQNKRQRYNRLRDYNNNNNNNNNFNEFECYNKQQETTNYKINELLNKKLTSITNTPSMFIDCNNNNNNDVILKNK